MIEPISTPADAAPDVSSPRREPPHLVKRHSVVVRLTHWVNVLCLTMLLMSGLQIFNARPQLDFGNKTNFDNPLVSISADNVDGSQHGFVQIGAHRFDTTGVLGLSNVDGQPTERAFPAWATLPSEQDLGTGRSIHFVFAWLFVANGLFYLIWGLATRHFRRDFLPTAFQWRHIGRAIVDHARLRFPKGEEARQYNVLQKITYFLVIFVLLPLLVLAGWTMSPGLDAKFPFLLEVFGGRQTARSVHFMAAFGVVLFVLIHVALVLVSGVFNNLRSMITGWYDIGREGESHG
jgi:thiosulfate reductase cytochrome b subunit